MRVQCLTIRNHFILSKTCKKKLSSEKILQFFLIILKFTTICGQEQVSSLQVNNQFFRIFLNNLVTSHFKISLQCFENKIIRWLFHFTIAMLQIKWVFLITLLLNKHFPNIYKINKINPNELSVSRISQKFPSLKKK